MSVIIVDGVSYDVRVPQDGIERDAVLSDGSNAGTAASGAVIHDTIGTYYNYTYTFIRTGDNVAAYDALYEVLTDPAVRDHTVTVPYGQSTITIQAYVTSISDALLRMKGGVNYWHGMKVSFSAAEPYRTP